MQCHLRVSVGAAYAPSVKPPTTRKELVMPEYFVAQSSLFQIILETAIAVGTIGAVIVALFGQAFRSKFFPPKVSVSLSNEDGELTKLQIALPGDSSDSLRIKDARFYHLRVSNARRWSPATDTRVVLIRLEEPGPDGRLQVRWTGDIPLAWRHKEVFPIYRTVGPDAYVDLCCVVDGEYFQLQTLIPPYALNPVRREPTTMVVSLQAQSTQANSAPLRLRICWDGKFDKGTEEMRSHLTITQEK
jgi:hypothetical protein